MRYDLWQAQRDKADVLECGLKVLRYETIAGKPCLNMWKPKAINPHVNYSFKTVEEREKYINQQVVNFESWQKRKDEYKAQRKGTAQDLGKVKVGDIYYASWGYDQTNIDFFQVVKVEGRSAWLRAIGDHVSIDDPGHYSHGMANHVMPSPNNFIGDKIERHLIQFNQNGKPYFAWASYARLNKFEGKPKYQSWYA